MLASAIAVQLALMIGVPLALFWLVPKRLGAPRKLLAWGAAMFVLSQALRQPFLLLLDMLVQKGFLPAPPANWLDVTNIAILCVTSGLFEEPARWIGYRFAIPTARRWEDGVTYGLGHGGGEALIFGCLAALTILGMTLVAWLGPQALGIADIPTQRQVTAQAATFWGQPAYMPLLGGIERPMAMCFHVGASLLVLRSIVLRKPSLLLLAIALHAATNAAVIVALRAYGAVAAEAMLGLIAAGAVAWIWASCERRSAQVQTAA